MAEVRKEHQLKVRVSKFEGKFAVLKTEDQQILQWPIKNLPDDAEVGAEIRLLLSTDRTEKAAHQRLAQAIINNILKE